MKITSSRITTLLTIGENLNIEFKWAGNGPKADTFESVCAFLNKAGGVRNLYHYVKIYSNAEPVFDEDDVFRLTVPLDDTYSADRAFEGSLPRTKAAQEAAHETVEKTVEKTVVETVVKSGTENSVGLGEKLGEKLGENRLKIVELVSTMAGISMAHIIKLIGLNAKCGQKVW